MAIVKNFYETLYHCPIVELVRYRKAHHLQGHIYAYIDFGGATGTAKDGLAAAMIAIAYEQGQLQPEQTIIEATSGTFATALAIAARAAGHPLILCVPESLSVDRQNKLRSLGAKLAFSPVQYGRAGAVKRATQIAEAKNAYFCNYFANDNNAEYHRRRTGHSILKAIDRQNEPSLVDSIVIGVGSAGTITGVGETIRAWTNYVRIVGVEPFENQAIGGGFLGKHYIQGLGAGFIPENYNPYVVDSIVAVSSVDATRCAKDILRTDAIPAGASAGATLFAAIQVIESGKSQIALCIFSGSNVYT